MFKITVLLLLALASIVLSLPVDGSLAESKYQDHIIKRRFINPLFSMGTPENNDILRIRTKRSYDECEKLRLCKLHARAGLSFFRSYELYFVNKENARLWDHRARSVQECEDRFGDCYK